MSAGGRAGFLECSGNPEAFGARRFGMAEAFDFLFIKLFSKAVSPLRSATALHITF
jgi:hypothetical protein